MKRKVASIGDNGVSMTVEKIDGEQPEYRVYSHSATCVPCRGVVHHKRLVGKYGDMRSALMHVVYYGFMA